MEQFLTKHHRWVRHVPNILTVGRFVLAAVFLAMILYAPHTNSICIINKCATKSVNLVKARMVDVDLYDWIVEKI